MPCHLLNRSARITWEQNDTTREWVPESRRVSFCVVERFLTFIVRCNPYTHRLKYPIPAPFPSKNAIQTVTTRGHETSCFHGDEHYEYGLLETETPDSCDIFFPVYHVHNVHRVNRRNHNLTFVTFIIQCYLIKHAKNPTLWGSKPGQWLIRN